MANIFNSIQIAANLDKKWEGLKLNAYYDKIGGVWTIGYGNTFYPDGSKVQPGDTLANQQAATNLQENILSSMEQQVRPHVPVNQLNDNQYAALLSIVYNAGVGNFLDSNLAKTLQQGLPDPQTLASLIRNTLLTSQGQFQKGLQNRRSDEADLSLSQYNSVVSYYRRNESAIDISIGVGAALIGLSVIFYFSLKNR